MRLRPPRIAARGTFLLALAATAACSDRTPTEAAPAPLPEQPSVTAALRCTVDVRAGSLACADEGPRTAPGVSAAILGGQGTYVRLTSSGTSYDSGTGILRSNVRVENLTSRTLGTIDGVNDAVQEGVRVFFHAGPDVTGGTGTVAVANADGEAAYTGAAQKYFRYAGLLTPGDTTAAREWRFSVPSTVTTFSFTVYVAAPVFGEAGSVAMAPLAATIAVGGTQAMTGTVRSVTGRALPGEPMAWWSSNPAVATVNASGVVTGVSAGTATITATSGERYGSAEVRVFNPAAPGTAYPTLVGFDLLRATIDADGADSVTVRAAVKAAPGDGIGWLRVDFRHTNGTQNSCAAFELVEGTAGDGVYECRVTFQIPWGNRGVWRVENVQVSGNLAPVRVVGTSALVAGGAPAQLRVTNTLDGVAPVVDGVTFSPSITAPGNGTVTVEVMARDTGANGGTQIKRVQVGFRAPDGVPLLVSCFTTFPSAEDTYRCDVAFRQYDRSGTWLLDQLRVEDNAGNVRVMNTAALAAAGYATELTLDNPNQDVVAPSVTGFAIGAATVAGNTVDSVSVSISGADAESGAYYLDAVLQRTGTTQTRRCQAFIFPVAPTRTLTCKLRFNAAETGAWQVSYVRVMDYVSNITTWNAAQVQAAGYSTGLTVTAP
jgi:hypothetical protein